MADDNPRERAREEVIEYLSSQYSKDVIDEEEFERRVELAHSADRVNGLVSLVVDLPESQELINRITAPVPAGRDTYGAQAPASRGQQEFREAEPGSTRTLMAIFSGSDLRGHFEVPQTVNCLSVFGGSRIDLRDAILPAGDVHIHAVALFGGTDIIVPEGVNVET
ncbi:LiaF domain-containing protein, partial [Salinispira pacifica]